MNRFQQGRRAPPRIISGLMGSLVPAHSMQEMVETIMKLVLDITTAVLLGLTFCVQTVSVVISLDFAVVGFVSALCSGIAHSVARMGVLLPFLERKAVLHALVLMVFNFVWTHVMYSIEEEAWSFLFPFPMLAATLMSCTLSWAVTRMEVVPTAENKRLCTWLAMACSVLLCSVVYMIPEKGVASAVLLLRCVVELVARALSTSLSLDNEHDSILTQSLIEMSGSLFWATINLHQLLLRQRSARMRFFMLLMHDIIAMSVPTRKFILKIMHDRYIAQKFRKVNPQELRDLVSETCSVCLCEQNEHSVRLPCQHVLHSSCLSRVLQQGTRTHPSRCPMCRAGLMDGPQGEGETSELIRVRILPRAEPLPTRFGGRPPGAPAMQGASGPTRGNMQIAGDRVVFRATSGAAAAVQFLRLNLHAEAGNRTLQQFLQGQPEPRLIIVNSQPEGIAGEIVALPAPREVGNAPRPDSSSSQPAAVDHEMVELQQPQPQPQPQPQSQEVEEGEGEENHEVRIEEEQERSPIELSCAREVAAERDGPADAAMKSVESSEPAPMDAESPCSEHDELSDVSDGALQQRIPKRSISTMSVPDSPDEAPSIDLAKRRKIDE